MSSTKKPSPRFVQEGPSFWEGLHQEAKGYFSSFGRSQSLGQNFLVDPFALHAISLLIEARPSPWTVEVGAGLGFLTRGLSHRPHLTLFELDLSLLSRLSSHFPNASLLGDFRDWDASSAPPNGLLVGNIPYSLSGSVLSLLARYPSRFIGSILTLQREVAQRVAAPIHTKRRGLLSGPLQAIYNVEVARRLPPGVFAPPPRVHSAVLVLDRNEIFPDDKWAHNHLALMKLAFSQRRKKVANLLSHVLPEKCLNEIPDGARAEDLPTSLSLHLSSFFQPKKTS